MNRFLNLALCLSLAMPAPSFAPPLVTALESESNRLIAAFDSIPEGDFTTMKGSNLLNRIVDTLHRTVEKIPVLGRLARPDYSDPFTQGDLEAIENNPDTGRKMVQLFNETIGFVQRVCSEETLEGEDKAALIRPVIERAGLAFNQMTNSYADQAPHPPGLVDIMDRKGVGMPQGFFWWSLYKVGYFFDFIGRDLLRLLPVGRESAHDDLKFQWPSSIPILGVAGRDDLTTQAVERIASDLKFAVREDIRRLKTARPETMEGAFAGFEQTMLNIQNLTISAVSELPQSDNQTAQAAALSLVALGELIQSTKESEPMIYGAQHSFVRNVYLYAMAPLFFIHPPLEPFLERTTYSPLVSAVMWTVGALYMARLRRQNSGVGYYRTMMGSKMVQALTLGLKGKGLISEVESFQARPAVRAVLETCSGRLLDRQPIAPARHARR